MSRPLMMEDLTEREKETLATLLTFDLLGYRMEDHMSPSEIAFTREKVVELEQRLEGFRASNVEIPADVSRLMEVLSRLTK